MLRCLSGLHYLLLKATPLKRITLAHLSHSLVCISTFVHSFLTPEYVTIFQTLPKWMQMFFFCYSLTTSIGIPFFKSLPNLTSYVFLPLYSVMHSIISPWITFLPPRPDKSSNTCAHSRVTIILFAMHFLCFLLESCVLLCHRSRKLYVSFPIFGQAQPFYQVLHFT